MKTKNKIWVVTGAGSGIGRELTLQLVGKGAKVAMLDINMEGMQESAELAGKGNVSIHQVNIADKFSIEKLTEELIQKYGTIDGIINNAGIIQPFVKVNELSYEKIEQIMNVNFYGTLYLTKSFLPHLLTRPEAHIVNISSMGGFIPFPGQTVYSASKAAVKILTEGLYAELKETSVRVTVVHPGAIATNITANSGMEPPKIGADTKKAAMKAMPAKDAARIIIEGIEKNKFRVLVGQDANFLDTFYRISPKRAIEFIVKKMSKMLK
ncbi:MAG TPA: SDR family oxidoreductase [Bacteroidales bacterium]|nr:SDR family oxidoreductase [Bacteroidales bacterium]